MPVKSDRELYETAIQGLDYGARFSYYENRIENRKIYLLIIDKYLSSLERQLNPENLEKLQDRRAWLLNKIKEEDSSFAPPPPKSSGGCFIATQVYSDFNHPKVIALRDFRDDILMEYYIGQVFVKYYYRYSPRAAHYLSTKLKIKKMIKILLIDPIVRIVIGIQYLKK